MNFRKVREGLKYHLVDTTALLTASNPIYSGTETLITRMSDGISINARLIASGIAYLGVGFVFARGRDLSKKLFKINDRTKELVQYSHDIAFTATMNLVFAPLIYLASGETDIKKITIGTGAVMAFSAITGGPMGYAVDVFRDLTGLKKCERKSYPSLIKKQRSSVKKGLAALLVGTSIATMAGIYALTPNRNETPNYEQPIAIEQIIENNGEGF